MQYNLRSLIAATSIGPPLLAALVWYVEEVSGGRRSVVIEVLNIAIPTVFCLAVLYVAAQLPDAREKTESGG